MNFKGKILITGASGYVGSKIYQELKRAGYDVVGTYNSTKIFDELVQVDLTDQNQVKMLITKTDPQVIIHTAADAHTSTCENDPEYAQKINVETTRSLASEAMNKSIRFIHMSTFACFNENATAVYPKTKVQAEKIVKELNDYLILRLSLVVGLSPNQKSKNFYNDLLNAYKETSDFEADSSWEFEMSYLGDVARIVKMIIENPNISNTMIPYVAKGTTSRYKLAKDLLNTKDVDVKKLVSDRIIPVQEINQSTYEKYGIEQQSYEDCVSLMKQELSEIS